MNSDIIFFDNHVTTALAVIGPLIDAADRIDMGMAFLSAGGWRRVRAALTAFAERGGRLRVVLRRDRWRTSLSAVAGLQALPHAEVRFHPDPNFHAKRINFYHGRKLTVLLGSANLTAGGLETNPEDGLALELDAGSRAGRQARQAFAAWWQEASSITPRTLEMLKAERDQAHSAKSGEARGEGASGAPRNGRGRRSPQAQAELQAARELVELARDATDPQQQRHLADIAEALVRRATGSSS